MRLAECRMQEQVLKLLMHLDAQLITYKAITCGQHGMISGQQAGSLDSASGSKGECPAHVSGQPPKYASSQHSDFEEIQVLLHSLTLQRCIVH